MSVPARMPDFCIIANNCWGAEVYKHYGHVYNTPVVGLYFYPDDYLNFIANLRQNLTARLSFIAQSRHLDGPAKYPVGVVNGIEVHFLHYKTEAEATEKWTRRCARVPANNALVYFKFDDRDGATAQHIRRFHALVSARAICFTKDDFPEFPNNIRIPMPAHEPSVMDGFALYYEAIKHFDRDLWIADGTVAKRLMDRVRTAIRQWKISLGR